MLALATTRAGDVPLFCRAVDGNARDKVSLVATVETLAEQLNTEDAEAPTTLPGSRRPGSAGSVGSRTPRQRHGQRWRWPTTPGSRMVRCRGRLPRRQLGSV